MPERSSEPSEDVNDVAYALVKAATEGNAEKTAIRPVPTEKNPAAVALGRLGGVKGGPARARALSKKRRTEIARMAAVARWSR
jgi:hypothetical protein